MNKKQLMKKYNINELWNDCLKINHNCICDDDLELILSNKGNEYLDQLIDLENNGQHSYKDIMRRDFLEEFIE